MMQNMELTLGELRVYLTSITILALNIYIVINVYNTKFVRTPNVFGEESLEFNNFY